jgi:ATP synthase F1 delta subunit
LIIKNRIEYFNDIVKKYNQFSDEMEHVERGVISAINSSTAEKVSQKIEAALHQKLNKKILLKCEENPSLLGGITIRLKNKIWDASFKRKLEEIKEQLCQ